MPKKPANDKKQADKKITGGNGGQKADKSSDKQAKVRRSQPLITVVIVIYLGQRRRPEGSYGGKRSTYTLREA